MTAGEQAVKYLNWASPVGAGWWAAEVWRNNQFMGTILITYVVIWLFANAVALLVLIRRNWGELRALAGAPKKTRELRQR